MGTVVVFAGGPPGTAPVGLDDLRPEAVIAADSGLHLATSLGWRPDVVVGDMDSVEQAELEVAESQGAQVCRYPVDKDSSDLELALDLALKTGAEHLVVVGSPSGRMDHLLGSAFLLASPRFAAVRIDAWLGPAFVAPVHGSRTLHGAPGQLISLFAAHGPALGVTATGLKWPLEDELLEAGSSRGLSNQFVSSSAQVTVASGAVLAVLPMAGSTEEPT